MRKLRLNRETVRQLTRAGLQAAKGGYYTINDTDVCGGTGGSRDPWCRPPPGSELACETWDTCDCPTSGMVSLCGACP